MGLYRDESGRVIELDDRFAEARGYTPAEDARGDDIIPRAAEARGLERGALGSVNAALTGLASGLTLGGSDYLLGKVLPEDARERLVAEKDAHPYLSTGGEIVGAVAGALATGGSSLARTPAGYLGSLANRGVEASLAAGGVKGTTKALGVMGLESAAQSAGQYIGHASLHDKEVTAEGLTGALGTGFAFGVAGGGAALGISNGVMAGRRLYSRVMGGRKAAEEAQSTWSIASREALEVDTSNLRAAEVHAENVRTAKMGALRSRNEARSLAQEAALDAQGMSAPKAQVVPDFEMGIKTDVIPQGQVPKAEGGMPTSVFKRPGELEGPSPLIDVGEQPGGAATSVFAQPAKVAETAPTTKVIPRGVKAAETATDLEAQLAGTKAQLDEGASLKDVTPGMTAAERRAKLRGGGWQKDTAGYDAELALFAKEDLDLAARRQATLSEVRYKATEDLLGSTAAKQERVITDAADELRAARKDLEEHIASDGAPAKDVEGFTDPQATGAGSPRKRQAIEILDDAHEEALLRVKHAADPQEAGKALVEAEELEKLLEGLVTPDLHAPISAAQLRVLRAEKWSEELTNGARKVARVEKASADLTDALGDAAHPVSVEKTKAWREAERDTERKVYDRTTRAIDDTDVGLGDHPKVSAAKAAKRKQIESQRVLDESNAQLQEAETGLTAAAKKVRDGERLKKGALREDAKLARAAGKAGGADAGDVGGIAEMIDIPGMPKVSDLPFIGPLLGAYLKFRVIKKAMTRGMGKVPATADARVAALASQTRDRVARAVDRSIGALERGAKGATRVIPPVAGVLAARLYDDGTPEVKGADIQDLAAARMRELAAYVHTPNAIERDVRRQLMEVTDPDIIMAAENQRRAAMEFLLSVAPKVPEQSPLNPIPYRPAGAQAMSFARSMDAINDPAAVFERLAHEQAMISLEAAEALRVVYPRIFAEAGMRLLERAQQGDLKVPARMRTMLSLLYKVPLDTALDPDNLKITQSVYDRKVVMPPPSMQGGPVQPSIANPVTLSQGLTPAFDRR